MLNQLKPTTCTDTFVVMSVLGLVQGVGDLPLTQGNVSRC